MAMSPTTVNRHPEPKSSTELGFRFLVFLSDIPLIIISPNVLQTQGFIATNSIDADKVKLTNRTKIAKRTIS